jgi:hypothetical protein
LTTLDTKTLTTLILLFLNLSALAWLSRQVSLRVQVVTFYATGWRDLADVIIFLLLMPGVFVHEGAHWLAARALGLRTGKFRVWPVKQGEYIGLGSVSVERSDIWRQSMVGIAPLVAGNVVLAIVGWQVFATPALLRTLASGQIAGAATTFFSALRTADGLLWAYVIFTVGNSMMPSSSDREPIKPVLLYTVFAALIYVVIGLPLAPITQLLGWVAPAFEIALSAQFFLIVLNLVILAFLWPLEILLRERIRRG